MANEPLEQFLKGVVPPEYESEEHQRQLRGRLLAQLEARHANAATGHRWKPALLLLALLGAGAAATEIAVQFHRYYFEGRSSDGLYHFSTEPETLYRGTHVDENGVTQQVEVVRSSHTTIGSLGDNGEEIDVEQARQDLEEVGSLRQADARELVGVTDTEVNGRPLGRAFLFKYALSDGRIQTRGESGYDRPEVSPAQQAREQQEVADLRARGMRDVTKIIDTDLDGQTDRTLICRYVLSDGLEVSIGEGDRGLAPPTKTLSSEQHRELLRLVSLKRGDLLDTSEAPLFGKTFTFQRWLFRLSDGTLVTYSEGEPRGPKASLTDEDWKELRELINAGAGEPLVTYQEEVRGKLLTFTRVKYILKDGTEVVQACGRPAREQ